MAVRAQRITRGLEHLLTSVDSEFDHPITQSEVRPSFAALDKYQDSYQDKVYSF